MPPLFSIGDRVRCLATRFNEAEPDHNGQFFADRHRAAGNGEYCFGTVKWVYSQRGRNPQQYRVLYDGDRTQLRSAETHLEPEGEMDDPQQLIRDVLEQANATGEGDGNIEVDNHPDDDAEPEVPEPAPLGPAIEIGGQVHVGDFIWTRVEGMGDDVRVAEREVVEEPHFELRNMGVDDNTDEWELFELLLPVPIDEMLSVVKFRASEVNDKYGDRWYREHIIAYLMCLFGASQFKGGTHLWAREPHGLHPPADFGQWITEDRFRRIGRYLSRGPEEVNDALQTDPWAELRWLVDGFNVVRAREVKAGAKLNPDESMFAWKGKSGVGGVPALSFVERKPEPLGLELKCVADGESGVMLHLEMQEGALRMARKGYVREHQATTACTLRLVEACGANDGTKRTAYIDSWFCSMKTQMALADKWGTHVIGCIKTGHAGFPAEAMRWTLAGMTRGEHVVFKLEGSDTWAIGWSDVHYKLYLATCGETTPGTPAAKKRQRGDGRNFRIEIQRPKVIAEYAENMGRVDLHNRYRQGMLKLHKRWRTNTWQTRMQNEIFGMTLVDSFLLACHFMPKWRARRDAQGSKDQSLFFDFLSDLMSQMREKLADNDNVMRDPEPEVPVCKQVPIGRYEIKTGANAGRFRQIQQRCRYCQLAGRYERLNRNSGAKKGAYRTGFKCSVHTDVFMCREGLRTCWAEHLAACRPTNRD